MFQLPTYTTVHCDHFQTRPERHGDVQVLAVDISCTLKARNPSLDMISPRLRRAFFCNRTAEERERIAAEKGQSAMELPVVDDLPNVSIPELKYPLKFEKEYSGHTCTIQHGGNESSAVVLRVCKVKLRDFTPIEDGTYEIKFTVSSSADIDEHVINVMPFKQQTKIEMLLIAPADAEAQQIPVEATKDDDAPKPKGKEKKSKDAAQADAATEAWVGQHTGAPQPAGDAAAAATTH